MLYFCLFSHTKYTSVNRFDGTLGNGRGQAITKDAGRGDDALRKQPKCILRCYNDCCLHTSDDALRFDNNGKAYRQFVTDSQYGLIQPLIDLHSKSLNLCRPPPCKHKNREKVMQRYRQEWPDKWRVFRKCRVAMRNGAAMVFGGREVTNKIETAAWNWAPVMRHLSKKHPDITLWDLWEQVLEQFHDVRNHLYAIAAGSLGSWGKSKKEMAMNLVKALFVRSHLWALKKRFPDWTDLLGPPLENVDTVANAAVPLVELDPDASVSFTHPERSSEDTASINVQSWSRTNKWVAIVTLVVDSVNHMSQAVKTRYSVTQTKWYLSPRKSLHLHCRLAYPKTGIYIMQIPVISICAIEKPTMEDFVFQLCTKPTTTYYVDDADKKGNEVHSGTSSVVSFRISDPADRDTFEKSMYMLYQRSMQSTILSKLMETPVQRHLHIGDPRLVPSFFSSSGLKRRGAHTSTLRPGDDEYDVIRSRLVSSKKAAFSETRDQSLVRMESADDPFSFICPGCKEPCTVNFDGWDVTKDGGSHNTCPVLDKDPSAHVMSDEVNDVTEGNSVTIFSTSVSGPTTEPPTTTTHATTITPPVPQVDSGSTSPTITHPTPTVRTVTTSEREVMESKRRKRNQRQQQTHDVVKRPKYRSSTGRLTRRSFTLDL